MESRETYKLLLVEDNTPDVRLIQEQLEFEYPGVFTIKAVNTFQEAIKILENDKSFDLIMTDLSLPDSSGVDTVAKLQEFDRKLPVLVISGNKDLNMGFELVKSGAQDYLVKGESDGKLIGRAIQYSVERKKTQTELELQAIQDSLTGLSKRAIFIQHLEHTLHLARRNNTCVAVMFIDLDHFKNINDSYGHLVGDRLLIQLAKRLKDSCRKSDLVSRYGGDEFAIVLENITDGISINSITEKLINIGNSLFKIEDPNNPDDKINIKITLSIGISLFPNDTEMVYELINCADIAMYEAKKKGRNQLVFYSESKDKVKLN